MPDLDFQIDGAEPQRHAAEPLVRFLLSVRESVPADGGPTLVLGVVLRCQVRIEPALRRYSDGEKQRLLDLFGTPERWGQTLRPMLWAQVGLVLPSFSGETSADLLVPCSFDFSLAASRYFAALEDGELPLRVLFSGSVFYESVEGALQVVPVPWDKEATFRLPVETWQELRDLYYPASAWLCLRRDVFEELDRYKTRLGLPTWEGAVHRLLSTAGEAVAP